MCKNGREKREKRGVKGEKIGKNREKNKNFPLIFKIFILIPKNTIYFHKNSD